MKFILHIFFLLCFVPFYYAFAQTSSGNIQGRVVDSEGSQQPDVNVIVTGKDMQTERGTTTNSEGYFLISDLPVGIYDLKFQHVAKQDLIIKDVRVHLGKTASLGEIKQSDKILDTPDIIVYGEKPLIDLTTTTIGENLNVKDFDPLPIDRDFSAILALLPQANTSYYGDNINIAGNSGYENFYFIDGIDATDPFSGAGSINLPYNFIREIQVMEGGYEAEYGKALGGLVNVITYSGGNTFSANAFAYWTGSALSSEEKIGYAETEIKKYTLYDFGISLSGPILRDKLWFFLAYNPSFEINEIEVGQFGIYKDKKSMHRFAGKLTWQASEKNNIILTVFGDPTIHDRIGPQAALGLPRGLENPDPVLSHWEIGGIGASLKSRSYLYTNVILEGGASYLLVNNDHGGLTEMAKSEALFYDEFFTVSGGYGDKEEAQNSRLSAWLQGTILLNQHVLKAGIGYENNYNETLWSLTAPGIIEKKSENYYQVLASSISANIHNKILSAFAQDTWQIIDQLRLNMGIRWEGQYIINTNGSTGQVFPNQWQPRIGVIFQPGRSGDHKIYGSFGRYYQQFGTVYPMLHGSDCDERVLFYSVDPRVYPEAIDSVLIFSRPTDANRLKNEKGLESEYHDEFTLGYQMILGKYLRIGINGIYKTLRNAFITGLNYDLGRFVIGNPGSGDLSFLDPVKRDYTALELSISRIGAPRLNFSASYILSRNYGNYGGLFNQDNGLGVPSNFTSYQLKEQVPNSTGLLPNDRTHVIKLFGSYAFDLGLTAGLFFTWQSGGPLSKFGAHPFGYGRQVFLVPRGSAGRMPDLWDLNLRLSYLLEMSYLGRVIPKLVLDFFHIGNPRKAVNIDQWVYYLDENFNELPNPQYGNALAYQPPFAVRLGLDVRF